MKKEKTLKELQAEVHTYISQFKEGYFQPFGDDCQNG